MLDDNLAVGWRAGDLKDLSLNDVGQNGTDKRPQQLARGELLINLRVMALQLPDPVEHPIIAIEESTVILGCQPVG